MADEITIYIDGPQSVARSHLAEILQDVLLAFGYQVAADPDHGFVTPASGRCKPGNTTLPIPPVRIIERQVS